MIVSPFVQKAHTEHFDKIRSLIQSLKGSDVTVWLVTGSADSDVQKFVSEQKLAIPVLSADVKVLKTIARANPVIWLLKDGTVKGKWSHNATPSKEEVLEKLQ